MAFHSILFHTSGKKNPKISKNNLNKFKKFALLNYKLGSYNDIYVFLFLLVAFLNTSVPAKRY